MRHNSSESSYKKHYCMEAPINSPVALNPVMKSTESTESTDSHSSLICFEQPLTERVRTLLRLEFLFEQFVALENVDSLPIRRMRMQHLLDVLNLLERGDLKAELLKSLMDARSAVKAGRWNIPTENQTAVHAELEQLHHLINRVSAQDAKQITRESELLCAVLQRSAVSGGTSSFDLPGYHLWLSHPSEGFVQEFTSWRAILAPYEKTISVLLRYLRASADFAPHQVTRGAFVHVPSNEMCLLRMQLPLETRVYPEFSGGKQRFSVRLVQSDGIKHRARQYLEPITMGLACCVF